MKYILICKFCGTILMKTDEPVLATLQIEIKCPNINCKKIIKIPEEVLVKVEGKQKSRPGLIST